MFHLHQSQMISVCIRVDLLPPAGHSAVWHSAALHQLTSTTSCYWPRNLKKEGSSRHWISGVRLWWRLYWSLWEMMEKHSKTLRKGAQRTDGASSHGATATTWSSTSVRPRRWCWTTRGTGGLLPRHNPGRKWRGWTHTGTLGLWRPLPLLDWWSDMLRLFSCRCRWSWEGQPVPAFLGGTPRVYIRTAFRGVSPSHLGLQQGPRPLFPLFSLMHLTTHNTPYLHSSIHC